MPSSDRPVVVDTGKKINGKEVKFNFARGHFVCEEISVASFKDLKEAVEKDDRRRQQEARERALRKQATAAEPIEVSLVSYAHPGPRRTQPFGLKGDYLLIGWHKTNHTPLLRTSHGTNPGYNPSTLNSATVLRRLTPEEWGDYDRLLGYWYEAHAAVEEEGRRPIDLQSHYLMEGEIIVGWSYLDDSYGRFPIQVEGDQLIIEVNGKKLVGKDHYELQRLAKQALHPDQGVPVLRVEPHEGEYQILTRPFDCAFQHASRDLLVFDTTPDDLRRVLDERAAAKKTFTDWVKARRLPKPQPQL
jgi:hypothetical protein